MHNVMRAKREGTAESVNTGFDLVVEIMGKKASLHIIYATAVIAFALSCLLRDSTSSFSLEKK